MNAYALLFKIIKDEFQKAGVRAPSPAEFAQATAAAIRTGQEEETNVR